MTKKSAARIVWCPTLGDELFEGLWLIEGDHAFEQACLFGQGLGDGSHGSFEIREMGRRLAFRKAVLQREESQNIPLV